MLFPMLLLTPPIPCSKSAPSSANIPKTEIHAVTSSNEHTVYGSDQSITCIADIADISLCMPLEVHDKSVM